MSVEPSPTTLTEPISEPFADEAAQIQEIWQALPDAHQVALVLQLADAIMASAYRPYFRHALTQLWPVRPSELPVAFPKFEIAEADLLQANIDEEEAAQLTDAHRQTIGETMRNHFIHDLFWPELHHVAGLLLDNLDDPTT